MESDFRTRMLSIVQHIHPEARDRTRQEINTLLELGIDSENSVLRALTSPDLSLATRQIAIWTVSRLNLPESVPSLLLCLKSEEKLIRQSAAQALGEIQVEEKR